MEGANNTGAKRAVGFFRRGECWYFGKDRVASFGPFDCVLEIVMGEWRNEQREIRGEEIASLLDAQLKN